MENKTAIISLEDISKFPQYIEVNGVVFFFYMWTTAWGKFAIGYKTAKSLSELSKSSDTRIVSVVIDENLDRNYDITLHDEEACNKIFTCAIIAVKTFSAAFNILLRIVTCANDNKHLWSIRNEAENFFKEKAE